jgi:predicted AlkP superfamily pyrophosphatase or phosphodiesterase
VKTQKWFHLILFLLISCGQSPSQNAPNEIKLVVVVSVDQMRPDYFDPSRFHYTGGLKKLYAEGLFYTNADLNYANTVTAPGHTTLSTGVYPRTSGITNNSMALRTNQWVPLVEDDSSNTIEGSGHLSPRNLLVSAVGDWLIAKSPQSKVISVAGKDRSAIFMGGRKPTEVYWYDSTTGHMVTSSYYAAKLPDWVRSFNAHFLDGIPTTWTPLNHPDHAHGLQQDLKQQYEDTPLFDSRILDFAIQAARSEALGQREVADLLFVGLSATDLIGHSYGTEGPEMEDQLVHLDHYLGDFIAVIEKLVGKNHLAILLTADHGALRIADRKINFEQTIRPSISNLDLSLQKKWKLNQPFIQLEGTEGGFLNFDAAKKQNIDSSTLEKELREGLMKIDGISDVYFRRELSSTAKIERLFGEQFQNSYYSPRELDFLFRFCERCLVYIGPAPPTQHGSPYNYDSHIPILFWGSHIPFGQIKRRVLMVDIAPTIANLLKIEYPTSVNGKPLSEVLKSR